MEFVDDIGDSGRDKANAIASNSVLEAIRHEKRISFSAEKCELLKINCIIKFQNWKISADITILLFKEI